MRGKIIKTKPNYTVNSNKKARKIGEKNHIESLKLLKLSAKRAEKFSLLIKSRRQTFFSRYAKMKTHSFTLYELVI